MNMLKTAIGVIGLFSLFTCVVSGLMTVLLVIWFGVNMPETILSGKIFATSGVMLLAAIILTPVIDAMEDI